MKNKVMDYTVRVFAQKLLGLLCYALGAGWVMSWGAWVYFGVGFGLTALSITIVYRVNPVTLAERGKVLTDSPVWDKWLLGVFWVLYFFVIHLVAGLEAKNAPDPAVLFWIGILLIIASAAITTASLAVNTYLESTARIQSERDQIVITKGVYGVVRHPTYAAVLVSCVGIALVFPTPFVALTAAIIATLTVFRTYLEDNLLKKNLDGYIEYSRSIKYRLIPFLW